MPNINIYLTDELYSKMRGIGKGKRSSLVSALLEENFRKEDNKKPSKKR